MAQHHDHDDRDPPFDAAAFLKAQQPEPFDGPRVSGNLPDALKEFFNAPRRVRTEQETIEDGAWFSVWCEIDSINQQIREIEITRAVSVTEILSSRADLKELHAERARLMAAMDKGELPATAPSTAAQVKDSASTAPVVEGRASTAPAWTVSKPLRYKGYAAPLHRLLAAAHRESKPRPTARDVVEAWRHNAPAEIAKVSWSSNFGHADRVKSQSARASAWHRSCSTGER